MHWKLGDGIARHKMHPAGRLHLFHGIVPLRTGLIHLLGDGILHNVLFVLVGGHQTDDLSGPGNYGGVQVDLTPIGQDEFVEDDSKLMERSEVGIQGAQGSPATRDGVNGGDSTICHGAHGNDKTIENVDGLHDPPSDTLSHLPDTHLLIEGNLQRSAVGNGHCNGVGFGRWLWRGGLILDSYNLSR
jgi:hypothetical protein